MKWGDAAPPNPEDGLMFSDFSLAGQWFAAMDSAAEHGFTFNEAISLIINCENQDEIDYFWQKLTDGGQGAQGGWLRDRFGVSWQVIPREIDDLLARGTLEQRQRVTQALLKMVKLDVIALRAAFTG